MLSTRAEPERARACLRESTLFGALGDDELTSLVTAMDWIVVTRGEIVMQAGDPADALYLVVSGRLSVSALDAEGMERVLREVGRGTTVGELALVTGTPRTATVRAVRDSLLGRLSRTAFDELVARIPAMALSVTRVIAGWLLPGSSGKRSSAPATYLLLPLGGTDGLDVARRLVASLGPAATVVDPEGLGTHLGAHLGTRPGAGGAAGDPIPESTLGEFFDAVERAHPQVVYLGESEVGSRWNERIAHQADCVLVVAPAEVDPRRRPVAAALHWLARAAPDVPRTLVLLRPPQETAPAGTATWLAASGCVRHEHLRPDVPADWRRLARNLSGTALGLVLSGGGARGFAHIGALRAFAHAGIEIDRIGGTSMGAFIAALWACELSTEEIVARNRRVWLGHKPTRGYTLPLVSLLGTSRSERAMAETFGERRIEDLRRDYFCATTNLTRNAVMAHRTGLLRRFVLASMSIPGVAAPIVQDGELLVDGGVLNNLPTDVMRASGAGTIVAIDVSRRRDFSVPPRYHRAPGPGEFLTSRWRPGKPFPGIARILERTVGLSSEHAALEELKQTDVLFVRPPVDTFDTFDMKRIDEIIAIGYRATLDALEQWTTLPRTAEEN